MLQVQVSYWTLMETVRHNVMTESIALDTLAETKRHNLQTEALGWSTLAETQRHNAVSEAQGWENLAIQSYNAGSQRINAEANAANAQTRYLEYVETQRHNYTTEAISWYNADSQRISANASATQASAAVMNASTNYMNMLNQKARWDSQTAIEKTNSIIRSNEVEYNKQQRQQEIEVKQQQTRNDSYSLMMQGARMRVQNQVDTWGIIEKFMPNVPLSFLVGK